MNNGNKYSINLPVKCNLELPQFNQVFTTISFDYYLAFLSILFAPAIKLQIYLLILFYLKYYYNHYFGSWA